MAKSARYAVVTPYHKESRALMERCIASVKNQTLKTDHIVVADGFPEAFIDEAGVRHIKLDAAHKDYGNVARGIGALLAVADGYEGIGFLDADNWLDSDHVAVSVETGKSGCDVVVARRRFVRPDGSDLHLAEEPDHIDSSCWWFQPGSYHILSYWVTVPREVTPIGDRIFSGLVDHAKLTRRDNQKITVNYTCLWEGVYRRFKEPPPPGAKPDIDVGAVLEWLAALPDSKRQSVARLCGGDLVPWARKVLEDVKAEKQKPTSH